MKLVNGPRLENQVCDLPANPKAVARVVQKAAGAVHQPS
jgi:hypothetical protein